MSDFKKLNVWKKSFDFSVFLYKVTRRFPKEEVYGITSQIRRASASVGANIAEGSAKSSDKDFVRYR